MTTQLIFPTRSHLYWKYITKLLASDQESWLLLHSQFEGIIALTTCKCACTGTHVCECICAEEMEKEGDVGSTEMESVEGKNE